MPGKASLHAAPAKLTRRTFLGAGAASLMTGHRALASKASSLPSAFAKALQNEETIAELIDQRTAAPLAKIGNIETRNTPGSVLKPLLLLGALKSQLLSPDTSVFCRRDLHIAGKPYPCTHPQSNIAFNAQEALAYSCNTWFATLGLRLTAQQIAGILHGFQLQVSAATPDARQRLALGLEGVLTSPHQIVRAYASLAHQKDLPFARPVIDGLRDSVSFGMAHNAEAPGLSISGKTGTASRPPREPWSHGWFAGFAMVWGNPLALCLYLPQGNGADAASLARRALIACSKAIA